MDPAPSIPGRFSPLTVTLIFSRYSGSKSVIQVSLGLMEGDCDAEIRRQFVGFTSGSISDIQQVVANDASKC